jgi:hypothetical protein
MNHNTKCIEKEITKSIDVLHAQLIEYNFDLKRKLNNNDYYSILIFIVMILKKEK